MIFQSRKIRVIIYFIFGLFIALAMSSSVIGWLYGSKINVPYGIYYQGHVYIARAGIICSSIATAFFIMLLTIDKVNKEWIDENILFFHILLGILICLIISALVLGSISFFTLNHVWIKAVGK